MLQKTNIDTPEFRERFLSRFDVAVNGCWIWKGSTFPSGYGQVQFNGKRVPTHRLSYLLFIGPIPDGLEICHKCDVRPCGNPAHLFVGTRTDNMQDCKAKGRLKPGVSRGEKHGAAKLTEGAVIAIRESGESTNAELAEWFSVSVSTIQRIKRGALWRHTIDAARKA